MLEVLPTRLIGLLRPEFGLLRSILSTIGRILRRALTGVGFMTLLSALVARRSTLCTLARILPC